MSTLFINESIQIPLDELVVTAVRSSGPGGQNVNKVNSKVQLQWNVSQSPSISDELRRRLMRTAASAISKHGCLTIVSQASRRQATNRGDCLQKLRVMILDAAKVPKQRKSTRPTRASRVKRRRQKEQTSQKKKMRRPPNIDV